MAALEEVDDLPSCEGLEALHHRRDLRGGGNHVQVVLQDHIREELEPAFLLEMPPRVEDDVG